jgi:murein L,D-transpeptidase YcbB/YkuD
MLPVKKIITAFPLLALLLLPPAFPAAAQQAASAPQPAGCATCSFEPEAVALEKALAHYNALAASGGWPAWSVSKKIMPHKQDARIPVLRRILAATGDYTPESGTSADSPRYDDALAEGVKHFQTRHGLNPDGTLGTSTQKALAVPVERRILQITATIARIREHELPVEPRFILVNLPAYSLYAVDHGQTQLFMRVIIGNRKNHTPLFDNEVTNVIFNPQWHVPVRIAKKELIPKLQQDPEYFVKAGFEVTQDGQPVDPAHLTPGTLPPGSGIFTFRQRAGDENALGKIKFNIPDSDDIYLHSTPTPRLFAKDDRALSHGCIRVENPRDLAYFVFGGMADWDKERIDDAYDSSRERWVKVESTPVHLVYWTAFVDAAGTTYFYSDVYGKDDSGISAKGPEVPRVTLAAQ